VSENALRLSTCYRLRRFLERRSKHRGIIVGRELGRCGLWQVALERMTLLPLTRNCSAAPLAVVEQGLPYHQPRFCQEESAPSRTKLTPCPRQFPPPAGG
jgi:hypothetical protein